MLKSVGTKGGASMPTYVNLVRRTDQGIQNYKDSPGRAADFAKLVESWAAGYVNCYGRPVSTTSWLLPSSPTMKRGWRPRSG